MIRFKETGEHLAFVICIKGGIICNFDDPHVIVVIHLSFCQSFRINFNCITTFERSISTLCSDSTKAKNLCIDLKEDIVFRGLDFPTSMAFLGPNDILELEKLNGTVQRIVNGKMLQQPILEP